MPLFCRACPGKSALKIDSAVKCANCDSYYHRSCAKRIGYIGENVVRRCCKDKFFAGKSYEISGVGTESFQDIDCNSSDISKDSFLSTDNPNNLIEMAPSINNFDQLWEKIEEKIDTVMVSKIGERIDAVLTRKIDEILEIKNKEIDELRLKVADLEEKITGRSFNSGELFESAIEEFEDRYKRKKFVLFANVSDSNSDQDDLIKLNSLLNPLKENFNLDNMKSFRLGVYKEDQSRPRLLKVQFESKAVAQWLIFNHKSLKFKDKIYCKKDKTFYERSLVKNAVVELKDREKKGEKNLIIKYVKNKPYVASIPTNAAGMASKVSNSKNSQKNNGHNFRSSK